MNRSSNNATANALKIIGLFKQLQNKQLVEPDVANRQLKVYGAMVPARKKERRNWAKNAYIYMAYLAGDGFDATSERVTLVDMETGQELVTCVGGEVE